MPYRDDAVLPAAAADKHLLDAPLRNRRSKLHF